MQNNQSIISASKLIADIDPALAALWLRDPFHRDAMVTAFHKSLSSCYLAHLADHIAVLLRSAIDSTRQPVLT